MLINGFAISKIKKNPINNDILKVHDFKCLEIKTLNFNNINCNI